jgi:hypothetical protein
MHPILRTLREIARYLSQKVHCSGQRRGASMTPRPQLQTGTHVGRPLTSINGMQHARLGGTAAFDRLHHLRKQNGADRRRAKTPANHLHLQYINEHLQELAKR